MPRFVKKFADLHAVLSDAARVYAEVRGGTPAEHPSLSDQRSG
jgi:hypothetical protein